MIAEAASAVPLVIATAIVSIVATELVVPVIVARPGYRMAHNINAWPGHIEGGHVVAVVVVVVVVALVVGLVSGVLLATSVAVEMVIEVGRGKRSVTLCITNNITKRFVLQSSPFRHMVCEHRARVSMPAHTAYDQIRTNTSRKYNVC